jgi:soluble lytic murein transglycosylase-like protein
MGGKDMKKLFDRRPSRRAVPRDTFGSLLRMRSVQAALAATAVVHGAATLKSAENGEEARRVASVLDGAALRGNADAPQPRSGPELLAGQYRERGYDVPAELAEKIYATALRHGIEPEIAFGLVRTESDFLSRATSRVGAIGLTQLMPATAKWFQRNITVAQLRDPDTNLEIGFRYLRELIDRYDGDLHLALTAYNRGSGTVDRVLERGEDPDNGYAGMVLSGSR